MCRRGAPGAPRRMLAEILFWSFVAASDRERRRPGLDDPAAAGGSASCEREAAAFLPVVSFLRSFSFPDFCLVSLHAQHTYSNDRCNRRASFSSVSHPTYIWNQSVPQNTIHRPDGKVARRGR